MQSIFVIVTEIYSVLCFRWFVSNSIICAQLSSYRQLWRFLMLGSTLLLSVVLCLKVHYKSYSYIYYLRHTVVMFKVNLGTWTFYCTQILQQRDELTKNVDNILTPRNSHWGFWIQPTDRQTDWLCWTFFLVHSLEFKGRNSNLLSWSTADVVFIKKTHTHT